MPLLSEHAERRGELAVGQIAREQDTDERVPEVSHGFAVVPWEETRHVQNATFPHLSRGAGNGCPRTTARALSLSGGLVWGGGYRAVAIAAKARSATGRWASDRGAVAATASNTARVDTTTEPQLATGRGGRRISAACRAQRRIWLQARRALSPTKRSGETSARTASLATPS